MLLVANKGDQTLSVIDPASGKTVATVAENGVTGHEVAASRDGRQAYVPIYGSGGVGGHGTNGQLLRVIDLSRGAIVGTVDFGHGVRPHCVMVGPKSGLIFVTAELDQAVAIVDPQALKIVGSIPTQQAESHMLAITRDETRGYTANVAPGTVSVLDLNARKTIAVISVAPSIQRISLSADDRYVFTADQSRPRLAVIDTATNRLSRWIDLPAIGFGTATTPDGKWLVAALSGKNQIAVVELSTWKTVKTIAVPPAPQEIVIRPDGAEVFVSCDASRKVVVIDPATWTVKREIEAGPVADGLAWAATKNIANDQ